MAQQATLYGPNGQKKVVNVGSSEASRFQSQGWGLSSGSYKAPTSSSSKPTSSGYSVSSPYNSTGVSKKPVNSYNNISNPYSSSGMSKAPVTSYNKLSDPYKSVGIQAKAPDQNIKPPTNILQNNQVKIASQSSPVDFSSQNQGLLAALARQKAGTANEADKRNLAYAQGRGWNQNSTQSSTSNIPAQNNTQNQNNTSYEQPVDITSQGLLSGLTRESYDGSQFANDAAQGLYNTALTNPGTSGQAYNDYQKAVNDLNSLKQNISKQYANLEGTDIPLEFQQGRGQVMARQYASQLEAAQARVNQAQSAINQQIAGVQTQQAGYNQAGGIGNAMQGLMQQGLTSAAGFAQPRELQYGVQYINPQTGQPIGNTGGEMNNMISYWANQIATGRATAADVPATILNAPNLKTQLQQAIQSQNPNYNPSVQASQQQAAASLSSQKEQLQASLNGAEANFQLLVNTANQGGVNNTNVPALNTLQQNVLRGLTSNSAVVNFQSTLAAVRSQYAAILGGGTVTVDSQNRAQQAIPDNISLGALNALRIQMRNEAQNRITGFQQQINSLINTGGNSGGGSGGSSGGSIWSW